LKIHEGLFDLDILLDELQGGISSRPITPCFTKAVAIPWSKHTNNQDRPSDSDASLDLKTETVARRTTRLLYESASLIVVVVHDQNTRKNGYFDDS
jgi:hypothetical protein